MRRHQLVAVGLCLAVLFSCLPRPGPDGGIAPNDAGGLAGGSCELAELLEPPADGGRLEVNGSTLGFPDPRACCFGVSCSASLRPTPDHAYTITLTRPQSFHARVTASFNLHFGSGCSPSFPNIHTSGCQPGAYGEGPSIFRAAGRIDLLELPAGSYFLWVETMNALGPTDYELSVWVENPPAGRSCEAPLEVSLDGGRASLDVNMDSFVAFRPVNVLALEGGRPEISSVCLATEVDRAPSTLEYTITGPSEVCTRSCRDFRPTPAIFQAEAAIGRSTFEVGSEEFVPAHFEVRSIFMPPTPGSCEAPLPLAFVEDGGVERASVLGDTRQGDMGVVASCAAGHYLTYGFTLSQPRTLVARVEAGAGGTDYAPALALRGSACTDPNGPCMVGAAGGNAELDGGRLPAGNYFLWVGGGSGFVTDDAGTTFRTTSGPFSLGVSLFP